MLLPSLILSIGSVQRVLVTYIGPGCEPELSEPAQ